MELPIKIAIVDDESLFVEGLALLFSGKDEVKVVFTADGGPQFLDFLENNPAENIPDVLLLDIEMKPMDGFEVVEALKKTHPTLNVIILSSHYESTMFGHMIRLGVSAFLPKHASLDLLVEAIGKVHSAGVFFTPDDHEMLAAFVKNKSQNRYFKSTGKLSEREIEVIKLICAEHTNQEIAEKLFLSKRTVESHRQRILHKINAKNTAGLVIYAISHEIYTPDSRYYI